MKYELLITVSGWGRAYIEAATEEEAVQKFEHGEWDWDKTDLNHDIEEIKAVTKKDN